MQIERESEHNPILRQSHSCFAGDAMADVVAGASFNIQQIESGNFQADLFATTLGNGLFSGGDYSRSVLTEGTFSEDHMVFGFLHETSAPGTLNGTTFNKHNILLASEGAPIDYVMSTGSQWSAFQFKREDLMKTGVSLPKEGSQMFQLHPETERIFISEMNAIADYLHKSSDTQLPMLNAEILYNHMLSRYASVIEDTHYQTPLKAKDSAHLAKKIHHYLQENASFPIQMIHLAELIDKGERTVERIFKQYFSISPYTYLKIHRLHLVRQQLISQGNFPAQNITAVAMNNGFMSMGYFSKEYKKLFNETPTETMKKTSVF